MTRNLSAFILLLSILFFLTKLTRRLKDYALACNPNIYI